MNKKLSDKDKKDWEEFVNSKEKIKDKDLQYTKKNFTYIEKTIDLHGYSLEDANKAIEEFIHSSYEKKINKIVVVTGKGLHSDNEQNPYVSKDLSILKYSIPNHIKENQNLMNKILKIDYKSISSNTHCT